MTPSASALSHPDYRPDVDGLRAVAVLAVVGFHAFPAWFPGGFVGVDVFFVISGFLISSIIFQNLDRGTFSFATFYSRRIRRIFPSLIIVLVTCFVWGWFFLLPEDYKRLGRHAAGGAVFVSNFVLIREAGYFDASSDTKPLLHLWSLGVEEQFYIIWPLLLWLTRRSRLLTIATIVLAGAASFYLNLELSQTNGVTAFFSPQTRFWEPLCGSLLAWLTSSRVDARIRTGGVLRAAVSADPEGHGHRWGGNAAEVSALAGALALLFSIWALDRTVAFPGLWALVPVAGAMLLILAGPDAFINRHILGNKLAVWLGLISYPIYLWHWPLLSLAHIYCNEPVSLGIRVFLMVLAIALAWATYRFVEQPVRQRGDRPLTTATLVGLMALIAAGGYILDLRDGLARRFPAQIESLVEKVNFDWKSHVRYERCYLQAPRHSHHAPECIEAIRPLVALWGDSHAASLYPGLKRLQRERSFGIAQLTEAACPPILQIERSLYNPFCNDINNDVIELLKVSKPDILLLHGAWQHDSVPMSTDELYSKLAATIAEIRDDLPGTRIIIIGPVPRWNESPQRTSFLSWKQLKGDVADVPVMQPALVPMEVDALLQRVARQEDVEFVSAVETLCEGDKCLARVGGTSGEFIATDTWHFSTAGSEFFLRKIEDRIFARQP